MKRFLSFLLALLTVFSFAISVSASDAFLEKTEVILSAFLRNKGFSSVQELADSFADNVASGEEWFVIAINKLYGNNVNFDKYLSALTDYVREKNPSVATTRQLISLAMFAVGSNDLYISETMNDSIGNNGLMSYVFGLHLCNNSDSSDDQKEWITEELLKRQLSDGGWAVIGNSGDPDVTSMTIQALAPFYHSNEKVNNAVNHALQLLSEQQLENGGYISMGIENPESPAQVLIALSSLGIDAQKENSFIKNGNTLFDAIERFQTSDHLYSHTLDGEPNDSATRQVLLGYTSYCLLKEQFAPIYCFSKGEETILIPTEKMQSNSNIFSSIKELVGSKLLILIIVAVIALLCCLLLVLKGKKSYKSYLLVIAVAVFVCALVLSIDISKPEDYYGKATQISGKSLNTTITIRCDSVGGKKEFIPLDGILLMDYEIQVPEEATVFDQLIEACKQNSIQLECKTKGYVSGINYLYEFDFGDLSGWLFKINNQFSSIGSNEVSLAEGDHIEWVYTLELGRDVGN